MWSRERPTVVEKDLGWSGGQVQHLVAQGPVGAGHLCRPRSGRWNHAFFPEPVGEVLVARRERAEVVEHHDMPFVTAQRQRRLHARVECRGCVALGARCRAEHQRQQHDRGTTDREGPSFPMRALWPVAGGVETAARSTTTGRRGRHGPRRSATCSVHRWPSHQRRPGPCGSGYQPGGVTGGPRVARVRRDVGGREGGDPRAFDLLQARPLAEPVDEPADPAGEGDDQHPGDLLGARHPVDDLGLRMQSTRATTQNASPPTLTAMIRMKNRPKPAPAATSTPRP